LSKVGHRRFESSRTWNAQNIVVALEIASISVSVSEFLVLYTYIIYIVYIMVLSEVGNVDVGGSGLFVPENIAAAAEITLITFSVIKL